MLEEAGTHASYFRKKYRTYPEQLQDAGYFVGSTGKAWGPGDYEENGRTDNPAGRSFGERSSYVEGFQQFMNARPADAPFCFWFGSRDAHRPYDKRSGLIKGKKLTDAEVPAFLPDHPEIRSDLLDYAAEIERFDSDCDAMLKILENTGELDNTIVIITSDNGMPFPRAKANCYEFGIHMPLAIRWKERVPGGRSLDDLVGFIDLTATIYEAAGVAAPEEFPVIGRSLLPELASEHSGTVNEERDAVFCGRERHSSSRYNTLGYPQRAIRTRDYLYIHNFKPERWPAGTPRKYDEIRFAPDGSIAESQLGEPHGGYHDIDACPSLTFLIDNHDRPAFANYLMWSVDRRPEAELFDIRKDPSCLNNLADDPKHTAVRRELHRRLMDELRRTNDARVTGDGDVWETYPRVSQLRWFETPDWAIADPESVPKQPWLDERRP